MNERAEVQIDECIHGIAFSAVREAWDEEYKLEREGQRSSAVMCSCCRGPSYGSLTCPTCSVTGAASG